MRPRFRLALAAAVLAAGAAPAARAALPPYPPTRVEVVRDTLWGHVIADPYRWLEQKDSPETRSWVRDQMAYTQAWLAGVPGRDAVVGALGRYSRVDARGVPTVRGGRCFFTTRAADQQQSVLAMRTGADGADVVLVDPNPKSPDHTTSVSLEDVAGDGRLLAYGIRKGGEDEVEVHFLDPESRQELADVLPHARYFGVTIAADHSGCWYSRWEPRGSRVWYHKFGDALANDRQVFGDGLGPTEIPAARLSEDGRWLVITVFVGASGDDTRAYLMNVAEGGPVVTIADSLHASLNVGVAGDRLVVQTNWKAPNGQVFTADPHEPGVAHWTPLVPESRDAVIEGVSGIGGRVFVRVLQNVVTHVRVYGLDGHAYGEVPLPGLGAAGTPSGDWKGGDGFLTYSSFNAPARILRYDVAAGSVSTWWQSSAPFAGGDYEVRQEWVGSSGGARIPFFVVEKKGLARDGSHRVLMTGYGGFDLSETPAFSPLVAAWLDQGGVYVSTNLRGGSEFGEAWHHAGMLANKQHVFDDFEAVGRWLEDQKYCTPSHLAIIGGSNGGLLVGAAMTQKPAEFGAVVCQVPLLDMLRYQRFLVARFWVPEYGSSENATQFKWLYAYSPYQHVKPGVTYPPVMFVSGDSDTRVDPSHARKMAALMQSLGGPNPVLLHYDVTSGHAGGKSVDKGIQDNADVLQFLRGALGMAAAN